MISDFTINGNTQEVSGVYKNEAFTIAPKAVDGVLKSVSEQECVEVLEFRAKANATLLANEYQSLRISAYPSIQEQLDLLYWDKVNGTDNWKQVIAAVKAEHPKG